MLKSEEDGLLISQMRDLLLKAERIQLGFLKAANTVSSEGGATGTDAAGVGAAEVVPFFRGHEGGEGFPELGEHGAHALEPPMDVLGADELLGVLEGGAQADGEDPFDADAALFVGELTQLLPELIAALGGEPPRPG